MAENLGRSATYERPRVRPRTALLLAAVVLLGASAEKCGGDSSNTSGSGGAVGNSQSTPTNYPPQFTALETSGLGFAELLCYDGFDHKTATFKPKDPSKPWGVEIRAKFGPKQKYYANIVEVPSAGARIETDYNSSHPFTNTKPFVVPYEVKDGQYPFMTITVADSNEIVAQCPDITDDLPSAVVSVPPLPDSQLPKIR